MAGGSFLPCQIQGIINAVFSKMAVGVGCLITNPTYVKQINDSYIPHEGISRLQPDPMITEPHDNRMDGKGLVKGWRYKHMLGTPYLLHRGLIEGLVAWYLTRYDGGEGWKRENMCSQLP